MSAIASFPTTTPRMRELPLVIARIRVRVAHGPAASGRCPL